MTLYYFDLQLLFVLLVRLNLYSLPVLLQTVNPVNVILFEAEFPRGIIEGDKISTVLIDVPQMSGDLVHSTPNPSNRCQCGVTIWSHSFTQLYRILFMAHCASSTNGTT